MAQTRFRCTVGYGLDSSLTVTGAIDSEEGFSGLLIKLFVPEGTETGQPLLARVEPTSAPVTVERRPGESLALEVVASAGSSSVPVQVAVATEDGKSGQATGRSNETLHVALAEGGGSS